MLRRIVDVREGETRALVMSFVYFFLLLSGYFILRPIRDEVAAASGAQKLPWLFAGTLTATLICSPLFSALVVRFPVRRFIAISYHFFAANLIVFYVVIRVYGMASGSTSAIWAGRAFFVWTSVFNLFVVSIFWSFMADVFRSDQAKRLFGFIGVGGTLGSITGSAVTAGLASRLGTANLLLISALLLELAILAVVKFPPRFNLGPTDKQDNAPIGGSIWASVTHTLRSPFLLAICAFLIFYTVGSTFLYAEQSDIVGRFYHSREARTVVLAQIELAAQILTVLTQVFFTGRVIRWIGLGATLAFLPALSILGFGALGFAPVFATLAVFTVLRRGSNFALTNPAMEVLFTVVPREDKYKAKNLIETFVYRGGDQIGVWTYAGLTAIGLGLAGVSFAAVPLAAVWLYCGYWLGREHSVRAAQSYGPSRASGPNTPVSVA